ncbi:MAG: TIGR01777 family oxidoreductase [Proteobacteria bacterium]|nr:TIGR01777 family oxidoreductase [Pseudomonadota bacterium]
MNIFVTGGTGFIGKRLTKVLIGEGHKLYILSRSKAGKTDTDQITYIEGNPIISGDWQNYIKECDAIVNLVGETIGQRWNDEVKKRIRESRVNSTRNIVSAIPENKKITLMSTSAVGYYGFHGDELIDETFPPGDDFLANVAKDWEAEALKAKEKNARVVITRFGLVLGENGGILEKLIPLFRSFLGGPIGSGKQWFSWVYIDDLVKAYLFLLKSQDLEGPFNITSPQPVRNKDFTKALANALNVFAFFPIPPFAVKLVMGDFADYSIKGQRVIPKRLSELGFKFDTPDIFDALKKVVATK